MKIRIIDYLLYVETIMALLIAISVFGNMLIAAYMAVSGMFIIYIIIMALYLSNSKVLYQ